MRSQTPSNLLARILAQLNFKNIFLFDGFGAILSAIMTGLVLPSFSNALGMDVRELHTLALLPLIFSIYSFCCYRLVSQTQWWMLLVIMIANMIYCLLSLSIILFHNQLTALGKTFFLLEIVVILAVVAIELSVYRKYFKSKR